jgi:hypothetical protein
MSDEDYIEPRIVESSAVCEVLSRLPRLPVRALVLAHESIGKTHEGRPLVQRAMRMASELGVGEAVVVEERRWASWAELDAKPPTERFDVVFFRAWGLAPDPTDLDAPHPHCGAVIARVLEAVAARFWTIDLQVLPEVLEDQERRSNALCLQVLGRGGAPSVRIPGTWDAATRDDFLVQLFEYVLHDAPLISAATRAWNRAVEPPDLFLPDGRRHGLDLARLLEAHRSSIHDVSTSLRIFQREIEAARPTAPVAEERWGSVRDSLKDRQASLTEIRDSCEEIDRDRDPAGWSRLAANIDVLRRLEAAVQGDRDRLTAILAEPVGDATA